MTGKRKYIKTKSIVASVLA